MRRRLRGVPVFRICLLAYAVLLFGGTVLGTNLLVDRLEKYEKAQVYEPDTAAVSENIFTRLFVNGLEETAKDYCPELTPFETREDFAAAVLLLAQNKTLSYNSEPEKQEDAYVFSVLADGEPFASFSIVAQGNDPWLLKSVTFSAKPSEEFTVKVYGGSEVKVNGLSLGEEYELSRRAEHELNALIPLDGEGKPVCGEIYTVTYKVTGLYRPASVEAVDRENRECRLVPDESGALCAEFIYDFDAAAEISQRVQNAVTAYSRYLYRDASLTDIAMYISREGELYRELRDTVEYWSEDGESRVFSDFEMLEPYFFTEDIFRCRVRLTAVYGEDVDEIALSLLFYKPDRAWMLTEVKPE